MLEKYITQKAKESKTSKQARSVTGGGGIKRNRSLLSMDNLDIEDDENSEGSDAAGSGENSEGSNSLSSGGHKAAPGDESRDSAKQRAKRQRGNFTERTARVQSMADGTRVESEQAKTMTLEEEVAQKLAVAKISQDDIDAWGTVGKDSG